MFIAARQPRTAARTAALSVLAGLALTLVFAAAARRVEAEADAEAPIELFVDEETGQVFTKPGKGRKRLGTFQRIEPAASGLPATTRAPAAVAAPPAAVVAAPPASSAATVATAPPASDQPMPADRASLDKVVHDAVAKSIVAKWFEKISLRGYSQFRYNALLHKDGDAEWFVPTDRSVRPDAGFFIRRARMIFSGDITNHVYIYIQPDMNALPADGDFSVQLRDWYADVAVDEQKEWRFRLGQSKVPFGWSNLQSSQNRLALERPDAINSAAEGERDIGIFMYWAPAQIRERFRNLVKDGLKGSGDYGVVGLGIYNGQGLNKLDLNGNLTFVGRVSYPFELPNGQFVEPGIQGYWGRFVVRKGDIPIGPEGADETPTELKGGMEDRRLGVSAIVYPQPFGFETEWNVGDGPELVDDDTRIGTRFLWGGYVQGSYRWQSPWGTTFPFVRWQYYEGGRKFARNAPEARVNEWDFGVEYLPWPELEFTLMYTYTPYRVNTNEYPYGTFRHASRLGMQIQWNY